MLLSLFLVTASSTAPCRVEDAVYRQRGTSSITARFQDVESGADWPSQLALRLHFDASGRTYWWLPWSGGTDGQQHLASTTDAGKPDWRPPSADGGPRPLGDIGYIGTDAAYRLLDAVPVRNGAAPAHFLLPDLREALWYRTPPGQRDGDGRQFFDLVRCDGRK